MSVPASVHNESGEASVDTLGMGLFSYDSKNLLLHQLWRGSSGEALALKALLLSLKSV